MTIVPETLLWIDPDGNQFSLSDQMPYFVPEPGLTGAYGLPMTMVAHEVPTEPGDREQYIQITAGDVRFPLLILGDDQAAIDGARRQLNEATRPGRGYSALRHTANDGVTRDLFCREMGRFRNIVFRTPSALKTEMLLRAADPYWYDTDFTSLLLTPGAPTSFFTVPFLPLHLSPGGVSGSFSVDNSGQAIAYPQWIITGPGSTPVLTNTTTGEVLTLNITLIAGQVLTIDTNPDILGVTREDGSNQWPTVTNTSVLWALQTGPNVISLGMSGTTTASQLQLRYKRRWEGV